MMEAGIEVMHDTYMYKNMFSMFFVLYFWFMFGLFISLLLFFFFVGGFLL